MNVIINGDDFGYDQTVNESIADLIVRRRITSATLIANAPALEDAVRRIPGGSHCSFGVHLNLTQFEPLTPLKDRGVLSVCLDEKGYFRGEEYLRSTRITSALREAFFKELCFQAEKICALGVKISHFDSHNHVHTMPALFPVVKRLQRHFGIRKVRTTWNVRPPSCKASLLLILKKRIWDLALRHCYHTTTTSGFTSFAMFYDLAKTTSLDHDSIELMVHPGHMHFEEETQLLCTDWQKTVPFSTELISYHDL
jgi:chitin disaccharide deacetylase